MDDIKKTKLDSLRREIDELDKGLLELFETRMLKVTEIAAFKKANNMTILDESREEKVLEKTKFLKNSKLAQPAQTFLRYLMSISRELQEEYIGDPSQSNEEKTDTHLEEGDKPIGTASREDGEATVGFQGLPGSYSEQALREYFGEKVPTSSYPAFEDVFSALEEGEIDYGVLPLENSSTGGIAEVYDLLCHYGFYIVGEKGIKVDHNLLALPGARLEDIREVYSHPQGLQQCSEFLRTNPDWNLISCSNTAVSAKSVGESGSITKAAIAGKRAAGLYGLQILRSGINNDSYNHTRFIVIGREPEFTADCDKISIAVAISHEPGSLFSILSHFARNSLNMLKIESRPIMKKPWEYLFYIDFEGCLEDDNVKQAVDGIKEESTYFQMLGNYKADIRDFIR